MANITAKQIAQQLHLSEAAVSMALHNKPGVSTNTRNRILETARSLGYDFSKINPIKKIHGSIAVIFYNKTNIFGRPFYTKMVAGVENELKAAGYRPMLYHFYDTDNISEQLNDVLALGCDGIILLGTEMQREDFAPFAFPDCPIVLLDTYYQSVKMDCVLINNVDSARLATNYLIKKRHVQPGYLRSTMRINNFEERADGFYKAVRENGFSASTCITHTLSPYLDGTYADMLALIDKGEELAACYFADYDEIAIGAMRAFKDRGYRIPEDIAIIGFDNSQLSSYVDPPLTTVHVPEEYMGHLAAQRIITVLKEKEYHAIKIEVNTNLIVRSSVSK